VSTDTMAAAQTADQTVERAADRRVAPPRLHYPERRTGFDRREKSWLGVLHSSERLVMLFIGFFVVMSAMDWALTLHALGHGAIEGNPVIAALLGHRSSALFFKMSVTLVAAFLFWRNRRYKYVLGTLIVAVVAYAGLMIYHGVNFQ
jgi:Domain of unknown function (DUF5658)